MLLCMWKWFKRLGRQQYHIEEQHTYNGNIHYIVHKSYTNLKLAVLCPTQNIRPINVEWYNLNVLATRFKTIEKAELALQQAIWKSAFAIVKEKRLKMQTIRKIKVPPWGNK